MHSYPFSLYASQRLNSIRFPAKAAMQLLTHVVSLLLFAYSRTWPRQRRRTFMMCPKLGLPGPRQQTVGNGWDPNATIDLYFDSTDVGLVDTDNNGSFGMALQGADHSAKRTHDTDTQRRGSGPTLDHRRRTDHSATGAGSRSPSGLIGHSFISTRSTPALTLMRTF